VKQEFIAKARSERQALLDSVKGVDEATLTTLPVCGTWTARDVLAHVAACDLVALDVLRQARAGEKLTWAWEGSEGDTWNEDEVARRRDRSMAQIQAELAESHGRLVAELESWPAEAGPFGPDSWDEVKSPIGWLPDHDREHAAPLQTLRTP
jgi:uncharacterized protein (TIGR03083 family)